MPTLSICPICETEFEQPEHYTRKTCSRSCGRRLSLAKQTAHRTGKTCAHCGCKFSVKPSDEVAAKYCSSVCYHNSSKKTGGEKKCFTCGERFIDKYSTNQRYCSVACGAQGRRTPMPMCRGCGENPVKTRQSYYCSDDCRNKYGKKKKNAYSDKAAICLTCEKEFSKPWYYASAMKYCSNTCAQKHTRTKKHIIVDNAVVLDSAWEALFWGLCYFNKVTVERFDRSNAIEWRPNQWYAPDFWLPDHDLAIEVKGHLDDHDQERWHACSEVMSLAVLGRPELEKLQREDFITVLKDVHL